MPLLDLVRRRPFLAVVALALLLGLAFQGARGLWEPDEGRYTNVALQMLHSGDYISLRRNSESLHFTKPPVTYWTIAASVATFGRSEWAVRLPIALAFVLTVALVFQLGKRFVPDRPWLPALIYATSPLPFFSANSVNTDVALTAALTLAMLCFVQHRFNGGSVRWLDAMWAAFGLAFLTKGPPALLPLLVVIIFETSQGRGLRLIRPLGMLAFILVGLGWYAVVVQRHPGLLDYFLGHEVYARIATDRLDRFPEWYGPLVVYLPTLLLGALPWVLLAARRLPGQWRQRREDESRLLWLWLALPLLVFCLARSRLPLYILPLFVPLSLLLGRALADRSWSARHGALLAGWIVLLLGLKFAVAWFPTDKDGRAFAGQLAPLLPGPPAELLFVEDMSRNGLNLYFDTEIKRLSFKPTRHMLSDSSYDHTVAEELAADTRQRVFIMKREVELYFIKELAAAGKVPILLGVMPDIHGRKERERVVYTLAGDFEQAAGHR